MKETIKEILREKMKINSLGVQVTKESQILIIMRGIPGAGKSTKAKSLVGEGIIHSTDEVIEAKGDYREFFAKMAESKNYFPLMLAHGTNFKNAAKSMAEGKSPVIIDNTNIKANEAKKYVIVALEMGYSDDNIQIVDIGTSGLDAKTLFERNSHGVPFDKIESMIASHKGQGELSLKKILEAKDVSKSSDVLYSGVVLDTANRTNLLDKVQSGIPQGWKVIAHHMTIKLGELNDKKEIGKNVTLTVTHVGFSDMAMAVKVEGYQTSNPVPHITIAVNSAGGMPSMSKGITKWQQVKSFMVNGQVMEITKGTTKPKNETETKLKP